MLSAVARKENLVNLVLLGPPGSGKGTQAQRLAAILNVPHISSGEMLRTYTLEVTPLAQEIRETISRGAYVPDEVIIDLVLARLRQPDAQGGFILDGFPRTVVQAAALDRALAAGGRQVDVALYLIAPLEVLTLRLAARRAIEGRTDDVPETIRTRLRISLDTLQPLIDYYHRQGKLVRIDAARTVDQVNREVDSALAAR